VLDVVTGKVVPSYIRSLLPLPFQPPTLLPICAKQTAGKLAGAFLKRGDDDAFREPEPESEPKVSLGSGAKTAGRSPVLS
jgi:hypothetical protein